MPLQGFHFSVEYIPGASNKSADCLSRLVSSIDVCFDDTEVEESEITDTVSVVKNAVISEGE